MIKQILILGSLSLGCSSSGLKDKSLLDGEDSTFFKFDPEQKACLNGKGETGLNPFHPSVAFEGLSPSSRNVLIKDRNVQCTDFKAVNFSKHLGHGYNILKDWDFRGSDLSNSILMFNFIIDAKMNGAILTGLKVSYGTLTASDSDFKLGDMPPPFGGE